MVIIMKRTILFLAMAVFTLTIWAQPGQQNGVPRFDPQKYQQMIEESLTKAACLTPEEAKAFFPLYNEMRAKQREVGKQIHELKKNASGDAKQYAETIQKINQLKVDMAVLEQKYYKRMVNAVPADKVFKVIKADDEFHRRMVQGQRNRGRGQGGNRPPQFGGQRPSRDK